VRIALDAKGDATAVWGGLHAEKEVIEATYRPSGGGWHTPQIINTHGQGLDPAVAVNAAGNATAVWIEGEQVVARYRPTGESAWQVESVISREITEAFDVSIALDPSGDVTVAWTESTVIPKTTTYVHAVQSASKLAGGSWQVPLYITAPSSAEAYFPTIAVDSANDVTAVWAEGSRIKTAYKPAPNTWRAPQSISAAGTEAYNEAGLVVAPTGAATLVWQTVGPTHGSPEETAAHRPEAGGAWQTPVMLTGELEAGGGAAEALDPEGNVTAVWTGNTIAGNSNVLETSYKSASEEEPPETPIEPGPEAEEPQEEGEAPIESDAVTSDIQTTGLCAPKASGYSAACVEATERENPGASGTAEESVLTAPITDVEVSAFQVFVKHTSKYAVWATIRRKKQSYVVGNAQGKPGNGWHIAVQNELTKEGAADLGTIVSGYKGCGWVYASHVATKNIGKEPTACEKTPGSKNETYEPPPSAFSSSLDCKACYKGHLVPLVHGTPVCLNVSPLNKPESAICNDRDPAKPELQPTKSETKGETEAQVSWRYVTREGRWVLVEIKALGIAEGKDAFIERSALPKTLPIYAN
jgi:hypothetical protein